MIFSPKGLIQWVVILVLAGNTGLLGVCYSVSMLHACFAQNCIHATTCYCATVTRILNKDNLIEERCIWALGFRGSQFILVGKTWQSGAYDGS